jgi:hypothetical protein
VSRASTRISVLRRESLPRGASCRVLAAGGQPQASTRGGPQQPAAHLGAGEEHCATNDPVSHRPSKHRCTLGACAGCAARTKPEAGGTGGGRGGAGVRKTADGTAVPRPYTACKQCRVHLCKTCFSNATRWDHVGRGAPQPTMSESEVERCGRVAGACAAAANPTHLRVIRHNF